MTGRPLGVEVALGIELRPAGSGQPISAVTREVNLAGLTLHSPVLLTPGQEVEFRILGLTLNLDGRARVERCAEEGEGWWVDLRFPADLSLIERERVARFVVERRRRATGA